MDKTFLTVREMSEKLAVSEKTIYRMINANEIPFVIKISGQWRFNSEKIEKWIARSHSAQTDGEGINERIRTTETLTNGLIIYRAHGNNRDELLDEILNMSGTLMQENLTDIKRQLLYTESIISSCLQGVSLMVPENDGTWQVPTTRLLIAFLEKPMDFKAIDHIPAQVVTVLLAANKTEQLIIKTRLTRLLMEKQFVAMLKSQPQRKALLAQIETWESRIFSGGNTASPEHHENDARPRP